MYTYLALFLSLSLHIYIYICMYVCIYIYIYIYIYIHSIIVIPPSGHLAGCLTGRPQNQSLCSSSLPVHVPLCVAPLLFKSSSIKFLYLYTNVGRGDDTVGNPRRAQICQFELFELILLLKLDKQFPVEQFEANISQSTVPSPPLRMDFTDHLTWTFDSVRLHGLLRVSRCNAERSPRPRGSHQARGTYGHSSLYTISPFPPASLHMEEDVRSAVLAVRAPNISLYHIIRAHMISNHIIL